VSENRILLQQGFEGPVFFEKLCRFSEEDLENQHIIEGHGSGRNEEKTKHSLS
jgi:hypothetical protein